MQRLVAVLIGVFACGAHAFGTHHNDDTCPVGTFEERQAVLKKLQEAGSPLNNPWDSALGGAEGFVIDASNKLKYVNGGHRRPTDPASAEEIKAAHELLFGAEPATTLGQADALAADPNGWAAAAGVFAAIGGVDPATIAGVDEIPPDSGDPTEAAATEAFLALANATNFTFAHEQLAGNEGWRRAITWWNVKATATGVPDRDNVVDVEDAIEAGETGYVLGKIVYVKLEGSRTEYSAGGKLWGAEILVAVDVSDPDAPRVVPGHCEVYTKLIEDPLSVGAAEPSTLDGPDQIYLIVGAMALYGKNHQGDERFLVPTYNGDNTDSAGTSTARNKYRAFATPYEWLDSVGAATYGATEGEFLRSAQLLEFSPSIVPVNAHMIQSGVSMYPLPLTMVWGAESDGTKVAARDSYNTLRDLGTFTGGLLAPLESKVGALTYFGRGLTFQTADAITFATSIDWNTSQTSLPYYGNHNLDAIADVLSRAIEQAWGDDEATPGSGFYPGRLATRPADARTVPEVAIKHSFDEPIYENHDTSPVVEDFLGWPQYNTEHRDVRDNSDEFAPPEDGAGEPVLEPNGKPRATVQNNGRSFKIDGYGVTYKAGLTWKFSIGFDMDAGLSLYHVRLVLPPTRAHPEGEEVPLIHRANIPNFGTDYSTSSLGNPFAAAFFESHHNDAADMISADVCGGETLPVHRSLKGAYWFPAAFSNRLGSQTGEARLGAESSPEAHSFSSPYLTAAYGTYGAPGLDKADPFAAILNEYDLAKKGPFQAFPYIRDTVNGAGLLKRAICLEEMDHGQSMWHLTAAQKLRSLKISQATISEAYNVVVHYQLMSDGKFKVGEHAHGSPAVMQFGIPGVSGNYASAGKATFASNHVHWHAVAIEPALKLRDPRVENILQVNDLMAPGDEPADFFGRAFHRRTATVESASASANLTYDHSKLRFWKLSARDENGTVLGGLKVASSKWGTNILPGNRDGDYAPGDDWYGSHWWLTQDVWLRKATGRRDSTVLLASGLPGTNFDPTKSTGPAPQVDDYSPGDRLVAFFILKVHHDVIEEELPMQNGFTDIDVTISPHNMLRFNPNILVRYAPGYVENVNNVFTTAYVSPYDSQFDETS